MSSGFVLIAMLIVLGFAAILFFLNRKLESIKQDEGREVLLEWLKDMRGSLDKNTEVVGKRLSESNESIGKRLDKAAEVIGKLQKELGQMSEIGRRMEELQDFLRNPKLRGNLGEQVLEDLICQAIPQEKYSFQYSFHDGQMVDAVIMTAGGIIPIDSKFPLENYRAFMEAESDKEKKKAKKQFVRDVRKHIRDISQKYIRPQEGTTEFALMYIPSESVAYEILVHHGDKILDYARDHRVAIVSPNQFNHFLRMILIGFERQNVQEKAKEILVSLRAIQDSTSRFGDDLRVLLKHVRDAQNKAADVQLGFDRLQGKIDRVQHLEPARDKEDLLED
ncbi:MAG: DNA recombination protein RmuC [Patescibacteria group bacterium]|nr:DNA recombination protein RmuC [Patescibacteria group bacterium]